MGNKHLVDGDKRIGDLSGHGTLTQRLGSCDWHHHDVCFSFPLLCMSVALAETIADVAVQGVRYFCYNVIGITYVCLS